MAVNCSILLGPLPVADAFAEVQAVGCTAVELWWPFDLPNPGSGGRGTLTLPRLWPEPVRSSPCSRTRLMSSTLGLDEVLAHASSGTLVTNMRHGFALRLLQGAIEGALSILVGGDEPGSDLAWGMGV